MLHGGQPSWTLLPPCDRCSSQCACRQVLWPPRREMRRVSHLLLHPSPEGPDACIIPAAGPPGHGCRIPGSPSWPIGPRGLLRLLSRTMPDFPMMRCAFLWPILVSFAASSGMRQARSSFVSLPSTIYGAPFRPWPAAGRNRAVSQFRIGCAECGVQVSLSPRSRGSLLWASPSSALPPACASAGAGTRSSLSFNM